MSLVITKPAHQHKKSILPIVLFGICVSLVPVYLAGSTWWHQRGAVRGATSSLTAAEIISVANAMRQQNGLAPLHPQDQLMRAAQAKANAMMAANAWAHNTPTQTPWDFIDSEGYIYTIAGENLAKGYTTAETVIQAWLDSPAHRENLLNPAYTDTGIAVVEGSYQNQSDTSLVVQYVATRYATASAVTASTPFTQLPLVSSSQVNRFLWINLGVLIAACSLLLLIIVAKNHRQRRRQRLQPPTTRHWHR